MKRRPYWYTSPQKNRVGIKLFPHAKNLSREICIATDHMSENDPYQRKNLYRQSFLSFLLGLFIQLCNSCF